MSKRILLIGLIVAMSSLSTGCFPRVRQCIANRWHMNHGAYGGACCAPACGPSCTPAFKVPSAGCSTCGIEAHGAPIIYPGTTQPPMGVPTIGTPMPLLGGTGTVPGNMPPKN